MFISISKYAKAVRSAVVLAAGLAAFLLSSCSTVWDDQAECDFGLQIRFRYDYNMSFGDAFAAQVGRVSVYVFDENGIFVTEKTEEGAMLAEEGYRMKFELPDGKYRFICWGGKYDDSFIHHKLTDGSTPEVELLEALMVRDSDNEVKFTDGQPLRSLFWGQIEDLEVKARSIQEETLHLMKLTNQIKVNLVNGSGEPISTDAFDFHLKGSNGRISAEDAGLLEDDLVKFHPYHLAERDVLTDTRATREGVTAEFSCPRILSDDKELRLHAIDRGTGKDVLDFPVAVCLASYAPSAYETADGIIHFIDPQEFLDRSDLFNLTFVLTEGNWASVDIQVLAWSMRIQNVNI